MRTHIHKLIRSRLALVCLALAPSLAAAGDSIIVTIEDDDADLDIVLVDGADEYSLQVELEFEEAVNLTEACLGVSAEVLHGAALADVNARLPLPANQSVAIDFPVRVKIDPPPGCGLQFDGAVDIEFETDDLLFSPQAGFRLFKAPIGGSFVDITGDLTAGSIRVRGSSGGFSEFVIGFDSVQDYDAQVLQSIQAIRSRLATPEVSLTARNLLGSDIDTVEAAYLAGNFNNAAQHVTDFEQHAAALGGSAYPDRWRAAGDLVDVEGELLGLAGPLRFSLARLGGAP